LFENNFLLILRSRNNLTNVYPTQKLTQDSTILFIRSTTYDGFNINFLVSYTITIRLGTDWKLESRIQRFVYKKVKSTSIIKKFLFYPTLMFSITFTISPRKPYLPNPTRYNYFLFLLPNEPILFFSMEMKNSLRLLRLRHKLLDRLNSFIW
jgi:hypothetical protein